MSLQDLADRSDMSCTVQDLIDGKIPDEYLKKRNFFYHFVFLHLETKIFLYPSKIDYFSKTREGKFRFFEPAKAIRESDNKVILERAEDFDLKQVDPKQIRGLNFNVAAELGDLIQPLFTTFNSSKPEVHDDHENIQVFFIHKSDFEKHKKYLDTSVI